MRLSYLASLLEPSIKGRERAPKHVLRLKYPLAFLLLVAGSASPLLAAIRPVSSANEEIRLAGVWAFDGRSKCKSGNAWVFKADGSYSVIMLPDPAALGTGQWSLRGKTVFYSLALPDGFKARPLTKRMVITEYGPDRLVAITGRRVRHVMHRCR